MIYEFFIIDSFRHSLLHVIIRRNLNIEKKILEREILNVPVDFN